MTFYSDLAATSLSLLQEYGQAASLITETKTSNPITGVVTSTQTTATIYVVETDAQHAFGGSLDNVDFESNYLLADSTQEISVGQKISYNGKTCIVSKAKPLNPAGTAMLYGLEVKS